MRKMIKKVKLLQQNITVFWQIFLLMLALVFFFTAAMVINNQYFLGLLTENYMGQAQVKLEQDLENMSVKMCSTFSLPNAIEMSQAYPFVKYAEDGQLPISYVPYLSQLKNDLTTLLHMQSGTLETAVYFPKSNSIVTRKTVFRLAEKCFTDYLIFSDISGEEMLTQMKKSGNFALLPVQEVSVNNMKTSRCMAMIIHPSGSSLAVLALYEESTILELLGVDNLPEGSHV